MLSLDLFNSRYEKKLHEGAVDDAIAHLIEPLSRRAMDIRTQLRSRRIDPAQVSKLEKEYEKLVQKRLDIILDRKTQTQEQQVPSRQDPFAYVKSEPKGIGDVQDPQQKMAQLKQKAKTGPLANVGAGLRAFIKGEPEPMDEEQQAINPRALGVANFQRLVKANMGNIPTVSLEFIRPEENFKLDQKGLDLISDYYDGLESDQAKNYFIYRVLPSGEETRKVLKQLGWFTQQVQPSLPGIPTQGELPLQEKKKSNSNDLEVGDVKVARELQKLRAEYPTARSDLEAVARAEIDSAERNRRQLSAIRGANEKQDTLLKQLVDLDQEQGREINTLDKENDSLEQRLAQVQATNAQLQQAVGTITGTRKAAAKPQKIATQGSADLAQGGIIDLGTPATSAPDTTSTTKSKSTTSPALGAMAQQLGGFSNVIPLKSIKSTQTTDIEPESEPAPSIRQASNDPESQPQKVSGSDIREHGGGIGPRQHWQDLMQETVTDVKSGMAEIYRRLAPKIEHHRDSFLAGQLYDELENYAELHGAEGEFKRMMATARNSAHMEYDTNPGGFQNWFWFLPFEDQDMTEGAGQSLSVQQLAQISDAALDSAYGYGRSNPGNTFGWQANLKSAAFAKQMIDKGVTDIEQISNAIHKGWNVTAQAFVKNPQMFDDSKTMAPEKLQAKIAQRQKLMTQQYAQLPDEEKEKDRVVARAMLQALTGEQGVAEAVPTIRGTPKAQPSADYTGEDLVKDANTLFTAGGFKLANKEVEPRVDNPKKINTTYYWRKKIKGLTPDQGQVQQLMIEIYNYAPNRTYWAINDWANDGARVTPDLAQKLWRRMEKTIKDSIDTAERENYWYSMTGNGKKPKDLEEEGVAEGFTDTLKFAWRELKTNVVDFVANAVGLPNDQRREVFVRAGNEFSNEVIKLLANHPARDKLIPMVREIGGYMAKARTLEELKLLMDKAGLFLADVDAGKFDPPVAKTLPSFGDRQGMTESADDVKKRMSKLEALALAANRAGDDAKCKMYQQKIQSLKQKLSQSMNEFDASGYDRYSIYMDDYDLKEKFSDLDDAVDAIEAYKRDDPKSRYADYNVRDLDGKVVWRNDAWQDIQKPGKIQFLPPKTETIDSQANTNTVSPKDSPMTQQQWMQSIKQQYPGVKFAQNKTTMQIFAMAPGKGKVGTFDPRQQVTEFEVADLVRPGAQTDTPPRRAYSIALQGRPGKDFIAEHAWDALQSVFPREYPVNSDAAEQKVAEVTKRGSVIVKTGIASEDIADSYVAKLAAKRVPAQCWKIIGGELEEATGDSRFDSMMNRISNDPWTRLNADPNWEYEIEELVDQHIEPWLLAMEKSGMPITRDNETLNPGWRKRYEQVANKLAQEFLTSRGLNPRDPDLLGKIRFAIDSHTDQSRNVAGQLSAYSELPLQRYQNDFDADGMTANMRDAMVGFIRTDDDDDDDEPPTRPMPDNDPRRLDPGNMEESSKPGEYYIHTVYFKDGTKKRIRVTSDEVDVADYYTKRGKAVDRVDYDFQIHSDMTEQSAMPGTTIPLKSVIQGYTVFFNHKTRVISITRGGDSEEAAIEQARIGTPSLKNFRLAADRLITKIESDLNEAKEIVTKNDFLDRRDYLLRMISADSNSANKQIIKAEIRKLESQAEAEGWITMQQRMVREDSDSGEAVEMAIMRRMLVAHTDLIVEFGLDKVVDAIEEVAYDVGDTDEIGSSDVSGWVRQVKQILGAEA